MWLARLWRDDRGVVFSAELVLVATILVLGTIVGLVCLRNQIVQEFSDGANALGSLSQSYSFTGRSITSTGFSASVGGSTYTDVVNVDGDVDVTIPPPSSNVPGEQL